MDMETSGKNDRALINPDPLQRPLLPGRAHARSDSFPGGATNDRKRASSAFVRFWHAKDGHFLLKRLHASDDEFASDDPSEYSSSSEDEQPTFFSPTAAIPAFFDPKRRSLTESPALISPKITESIDSPQLSPKHQEENRKRANVKQTVLNILKSFVGTGVLVLPHIFACGGLVATPLCLCFFFVVAIYCIQLLIACVKSTGLETYGQVGQAAFGPQGRFAVELSIFMSQLGFCSVYTVFITKNIAAVAWSFPEVMSAHGTLPVIFSVLGLTVSQSIIYIPMAWIRRLKYFAPFVLVADFCISAGIVVIASLCCWKLIFDQSTRTLRMFNWEQMHLMIGSIVFLWEGIGLVLPIRASMKSHIQPKFQKILTITLSQLLAVYILFGGLGYITYGEQIDTFIVGNLPDSLTTYLIKVMYVFSVIVSFPLQLFPATKVLEHLFWGAGGHVTVARKWKKNLLRGLLVLLALCFGYFGGSKLDVFISLLGTVCCLPLAYVFPPFFYMKLVSGWSFPCLLCSLGGICLMVWNTLQTIKGLS